MLTRENYTEQHIYDLWKETGADPSILERTVFAFQPELDLPVQLAEVLFIYVNKTGFSSAS